MATVTRTVELVPSGYTGLTSLSTSSSYPIDNGYKGQGDTSTYARLSLSTSTTGYLYYTFDTSVIPAGATITGITAKATVRVSNTSRVTDTKCQLFSGSTAKGSNVTFASTSTSNTVTLSTGLGWTRADLNDLRLKIGGTGSSSSQSKYIYFYGATVTITYTVTSYNITIQNSTAATVTASESEAAAGENVVISADTLSGITITDNGTDITDQFEEAGEETVSETAESFTTGLSASGANFYTSSSSTGNYFSYAVGHTAEAPGSTSTSYNTYVKDNNQNTATGWAIYDFDFSDIPAGAAIKSVTVKAYGACENTTHDSTHKAEIALYSGNTLKSTAQNFSSTSNSVMTVSSPGTWTREELQDAKVRFTVAYYGGRCFGITWTVVYELDGYIYTITAIASNHTIVVAPSGGGGNPPVITVNTPSRSIISDESGYDQCVCTFTSDLALQQWEARATKAGVTPARGVGLLVESGGSLAANTPATIYVENEELTRLSVHVLINSGWISQISFRVHHPSCLHFHW